MAAGSDASIERERHGHACTPCHLCTPHAPRATRHSHLRGTSPASSCANTLRPDAAHGTHARKTPTRARSSQSVRAASTNPVHLFCAHASPTDSALPVGTRAHGLTARSLCRSHKRAAQPPTHTSPAAAVHIMRWRWGRHRRGRAGTRRRLGHAERMARESASGSDLWIRAFSLRPASEAGVIVKDVLAYYLSLVRQQWRIGRRGKWMWRRWRRRRRRCERAGSAYRVVAHRARQL